MTEIGRNSALTRVVGAPRADRAVERLTCIQHVVVVGVGHAARDVTRVSDAVVIAIDEQLARVTYSIAVAIRLRCVRYQSTVVGNVGNLVVVIVGIHAVDSTVAVRICIGDAATTQARRGLERIQGATITRIPDAVTIIVGQTARIVTRIRHSVVFAIHKGFARLADAIRVAIGLRWIGEKWAVINSVTDAVMVAVTLNRNGVLRASGDRPANAEILRDRALLGGNVFPPRANET